MSAERQVQQQKVTIHFLNGEEGTGSLLGFSPRKSRLSLQTESDRLEYIDVPEIALICFHRTTGDNDSPPKPKGVEPLYVHTLIKQTFHVLISDTKAYPAGFFAFPEKETSPFTHYFFYNHGVRLLEQSKPLGQLMVNENSLSKENVKKALAEQKNLKKQPLGDLLVEKKKVKTGDVKKALVDQKKKRKQLGDLLVESSLISEVDLELALSEQKKNRGLRIGEALIRMGAITEQEMISALAKKFHLPFVDLENYPIEESAIKEVGIHILLKHQILPVASDEYTLTIALSDPMNIQSFDEVRFQTKKVLLKL